MGHERFAKYFKFYEKMQPKICFSFKYISLGMSTQTRFLPVGLHIHFICLLIIYIVYCVQW
jgi:hypothetical protein